MEDSKIRARITHHTLGIIRNYEQMVEALNEIIKCKDEIIELQRREIEEMKKI